MSPSENTKKKGGPPLKLQWVIRLDSQPCVCLSWQYCRCLSMKETLHFNQEEMPYPQEYLRDYRPNTWLIKDRLLYLIADGQPDCPVGIQHDCFNDKPVPQGAPVQPAFQGTCVRPLSAQLVTDQQSTGTVRTDLCDNRALMWKRMEPLSSGHLLSRL